MAVFGFGRRNAVGRQYNGGNVSVMDGMFKNCVVAPAEVKAKGMEYFDDNEDLKTAEKLIAAIEQFLRS